MDTQEMTMLISTALPEAGKEITTYRLEADPYKCIAMVVNETVRRLRNHDLIKVVDCFQLADKIYSLGNSIVRNAIENVFVYSITGFRKKCNRLEWSVLQEKMPVTLRTLYHQQLFSKAF